MQLEVRANYDDRTARVVHALAQQVTPESALLPLEHVGERLQLAASPCRGCLAPATVVNQGIHSLLEHALFIADDDVGCPQLEQPLESVVAVDNSPIEIVEIAGGEATAVQLHHRTQVGGNDRQDGEDHPLRPVVGPAQGLHHRQPLGSLLAPLLGTGLSDLRTQFLSQSIQVDLGYDITEGLGTHAGLEHGAPPLR